MMMVMTMMVAVVMIVVMIVIVSAHAMRISPSDAACRGLQRNAAITLVLAAPDGIVTIRQAHIASRSNPDTATMAQMANIVDLLTEQISNPDTQWSLGTFGGIAEFSRDRDEPATLTTSDSSVSAVTARGGVAITIRDGLRPFASESITRKDWSHRVALCLPQDTCVMNRRTVLTELNRDSDALREEDRDGVLFDLGLNALQADLCVRIRDDDVIARLRPCLNRPVFDPDNPAMSIILATNPHRVFISRAGRVEVYQPIPPPTGKSPEGPHTHVLPKLLRSHRTHPATEPIPDGWIPCAHLYPAHPARNALGVAQAFDATRHDAFQELLDGHGHAEAVAAKKQIVAAIVNEASPDSQHVAQDRITRASIRIAIRQLMAAQHPSRSLPAWRAMFDHVEASGEDDDDTLQIGH